MSDVQPYSQEISRRHPALIMFLLDQSLSMSDAASWTNGEPMSAMLASAINRIIHELILRSQKGDRIERYFDVSVLGYGQVPGLVTSAFEGPLAGRTIVDLPELAFNPARIDYRTYAPVWVDPVASGYTPLCAALREARRLAEGWITSHRDSFPPIVLNVTDGESTDGEPDEDARALRELSTDYGNLLLFNCHLSKAKEVPVSFPTQLDEVPADPFARRLFHMSSQFPTVMAKLAVMEGLPLRPGARGFVFNADASELVRFLILGTRPINQSGTRATNPRADVDA